MGSGSGVTPPFTFTSLQVAPYLRSELRKRNACKAPLYRNGVFVVWCYVRTLAGGNINDSLGELVGVPRAFGNHWKVFSSRACSRRLTESPRSGIDIWQRDGGSA